MGHSQAAFTLRGVIHEKLTLVNKSYQVKVSVNGGGEGGLIKEKCVNLVCE